MKYLILFSFLASIFFLGNPTFTQKVIQIKEWPLSQNEEKMCRKFLAHEPVRSPYLNSLHYIFEKQLTLKLNGASCSKSFLDKKVDGLVRNFLKDKLNVHKPLVPENELAKRAKWDPHHHVASIFALHYPKSCHLLPNFDLAYNYLSNARKENPKDYAPFVSEVMAEESFPEITEVGCSYDKWHVENNGKKFLPILCHKRGQGAVLRSDVRGYDVCGPENEKEYQSLKSFFETVPEGKVIRVHMGETVIPQRGRDNITHLLDEAEKYYHSSKPLRIGHGTHISLNDMIRVAKKGYYIEACLSSNKRNGIIEKRSEYPLGVMLLLNVKTVIGTDGGPLYSTTLPLEYAYAKRSLEKFCHKLQSSDETITLPNGDQLCYKHIGLDGDKVLTYKELGKLMQASDYEKLKVERLVENAQELYKKCYGE